MAHGFQTLTDDCEVLYQMGHRYVPEAARGVRFDDPAFGDRVAEPAGERIDLRAGRLVPDYEPRFLRGNGSSDS